MDFVNLVPDVEKLLSVHYTSGRKSSISAITIHYNAGDLTVEGCYSVWQTREASAHYQVESGGRVGRLVRDSDTAWHCGPGNSFTIGIEHANKSDGTITSTCLDVGAHLTAALCKKYNLGKPQWDVNVFPHSHFMSTSCPGQIYGSQKEAYIQKAQYYYNNLGASGSTGISWDQASTTEEKIWRYLVGVAGMTKAGAAGVMGNMEAESGIQTNNVQNGMGYSDEAYTSGVDNGSISEYSFVHDSRGYGLVQWTYYSLKQTLYNNTKGRGKSISDLEGQLVTLVEQLKSGYSGLWNTLTTSNDVQECAVAFLLQYERPANQSSSVQSYRTSLAQKWYDKFKDLDISGGSSSSYGTELVIEYDRKDPLIEEFGYAVEDTENPNLGKKMKAQKEKSSYRVSAINTAELFNDILDTFGLRASTASGSTSSSSGEQVAGRAVTQSGKVLTSGTKKEMPSGQAQTGIIANYTSYVQFYGRWSSGTTQRTLSEIWGQQGKPSNHAIATISGYYLIAPGRYFSNSAGDILEVHLEDGTAFMCIVGDTKGSDTGNEYGHVLGSGGAVDVIEWEAATTNQSELRNGLSEAGWLGKKVSYMINYGTWLQ